MAEILFPMTSTPGEHRQHGRGRLINMFAEPIVTDDRQGQQNKNGLAPSGGNDIVGNDGRSDARALSQHDLRRRTAARRAWRHGAQFRDQRLEHGDGGSFAGLPGQGDLGEEQQDPARHHHGGSGRGRFPGHEYGVTSYAPAALPIPNSVCFLSGFFIFSIGDGRMFSTDANALTINAANYATAETKPDTLLRVVPAGKRPVARLRRHLDGGLGSADQQFGFSVLLRQRAALRPHRSQRHRWNRGRLDERDILRRAGLWRLCVQQLSPLKISPPDLDRLIKQVMIKDEIEVAVFGHSGRGIVVVQTSRWSWHFDCNTLKWHERKSHLQDYWRHLKPEYAWNVWVCGDRETTNLHVIDATSRPRPARL